MTPELFSGGNLFDCSKNQARKNIEHTQLLKRVHKTAVTGLYLASKHMYSLGKDGAVVKYKLCGLENGKQIRLQICTYIDCCPLSHINKIFLFNTKNGAKLLACGFKHSNLIIMDVENKFIIKKIMCRGDKRPHDFITDPSIEVRILSTNNK